MRFLFGGNGMDKLKVAAYCRVSTNLEEQESSLETQIPYYGRLIAEHKDWQIINYMLSVLPESK